MTTYKFNGRVLGLQCLIISIATLLQTGSVASFRGGRALGREDIREHYPDIGFVQALDRLDYIEQNREPYIVNSVADKSWYPDYQNRHVEYAEEIPENEYPDYDIEYFNDDEYQYIAELAAREQEPQGGTLEDLSDTELVGMLNSLSGDSLGKLSDYLTAEGNEAELARMLARMENMLLEQLVDDINDENSITSLIGDIEKLGEELFEGPQAAQGRVVTLDEYEPLGSGQRLLDGSLEDSSLYPFMESVGMNPADYQDLKRSYMLATKRHQNAPGERYYIQSDPFEKF